MNRLGRAAALCALLGASPAGFAGKVGVINNESYGLNGLTLPSNVTSAPSPAAPAVGGVSVAPSVSVPPAVSNAIISAAGGTDRSAVGGQVAPTMAQTINALSTMVAPGSFSPGQASAAISKITSILNNVDLTPSQATQMIQLREALEASATK